MTVKTQPSLTSQNLDVTLNAVPSLVGKGGHTLLLWGRRVGSIPTNSDAQNVPSFRRWQFEMKLSPFKTFPFKFQYINESSWIA